MATSAWGGSFGEAPNSAWGDSFGFEGFAPPAVVTPTIPPGGGRGLDYLSWWEREWARIKKERAEKRKAKKVPKRKRTLLEELDETVLELRARASGQETPQEVKREIVRLERFAEIDALNAQVTLQQIRLQIEFAEAIMREMDDEEIIILAIH